MNEKQKEINLLFLEALEKPTEAQRQSYLEQVSGDNPQLRVELDSLLKAHNEAGDFLDAPIFEPDFVMDESPISEGPGTVIDRYKLLEKIGEGGMAVVYMAEQTEPIRRKVALKIIKLGMDTKSVIARFEAERQALAMMDHPNIAKVLDAGATETGRPYFVMELVIGVSITEYCDKNNLSTKERLALFIQVCNAVQHAHQKGVIHRDIKPTNVMVTQSGGHAVPKVIDFGIAKATDQRLTEKTLFTRYAQIIGTPAYMSPEQAGLGETDIDIRSDVYSLGTLLYELLTGSTPFDSDYLHSKGYGEIQRIIREEEPTKPSTKISTTGEALIDIAKCRQASPETLKKLIRVELDWIVMKTLEKDRNYRYDSASEFAADIKRYLNNEPVLAGPPSALYRIRKFVQRRKVLVTATTAVAAALIIGLIVSTSLYLRMRQALNTVSHLENKVEIDSMLSTAQKLHAQGRYQDALNEIDTMLDTQNPNPEAQLLKARLLVEVGRNEDAETQLIRLTEAEPEIAGAAFSLLAQINIGSDDNKAKEYESLAASLLPETAEAYSLRAMTSSSPETALQWLDKAIELDPSHYPSRKARVLTYYGLGDVQKVKEEIGVLIALRPADYLGYAIRALLHLDSERFKEAIDDLTLAIDLCENKTALYELYQQRYETYREIGDHASVIADARSCAELDPQTYNHRVQIFCSLLELNDFAAAKDEYRSIVQTSHMWDFRFNFIMAIHLFNVLSEGKSFTIPPDMAHQRPFAQMQKVAQCYDVLENKATLLQDQGLQGFMLWGWSPDGKEILCGWIRVYGGITGAIRRSAPSINPGRAGLKIINVETGAERDVTSAYTISATWSPDGEYIAYTDPNRHICIVPANGGQSRKLIPGVLPQWSQDSRRLYFKPTTGLDYVCAINIDDPEPVPEKIIECHHEFVVNENENWIACTKSTGIEIIDLSSGKLLYEFHCPWPLDTWNVELSSDGRELYFRSWWSSIIIGPIFFDIEEKQLYKVLDYPVDQIFRTRDGSKLVIGTRPDAWIMEVDPDVPIGRALGQKIPENDLISYEIERLSQEIAADPSWPKNYIRRAIAYISVNQYQKAQADMQQYSTLAMNDEHMSYEILWWLKQSYKYQLDKQAEFLFPYANKLMEHFPSDLPSHWDLIEKIVEINTENVRNDLARLWKVNLQKPDSKE